MDRTDHKVPGKPSRVLAAALASDQEAVRAAIDAGDDVDAWDDLGMTPLLYTVFRGDAEAVGMLLRAGADPNRPHRDDPTATPLWHAREDFGLHEIAALLETAGAKDAPPNTYLHLTALDRAHARPSRAMVS